MKKLTRLLLVMVLALAMMAMLAGCGCEKESGGYVQISTDEAVNMMAEQDDYVILDVRTPEEFAEKHIAGAVNLPNEEIGTEAIDELADLDQLILGYCRSGNRSKQASEKLAGLEKQNKKQQSKSAKRLENAGQQAFLMGRMGRAEARGTTADAFSSGISIFALKRMFRGTARYGFVPEVRQFGAEFPLLQGFCILLVL